MKIRIHKRIKSGSDFGSVLEAKLGRKREPRQAKTGQDRRSRQDKTGQDRTRQDKTGQDRTRQAKTGSGDLSAGGRVGSTPLLGGDLCKGRAGRGGW